VQLEEPSTPGDRCRKCRKTPYVTFWSEEKQHLEARIAALEMYNREPKAKMAELVASQKTKKSNTVEARHESMADVQQRVSRERLRVVTAAATDERDHSTLRREQLADDDLG
jgi:hypothetical protein